MSAELNEVLCSMLLVEVGAVARLQSDVAEGSTPVSSLVERMGSLATLSSTIQSLNFAGITQIHLGTVKAVITKTKLEDLL